MASWLRDPSTRRGTGADPFLARSHEEEAQAPLGNLGRGLARANAQAATSLKSKAYERQCKIEIVILGAVVPMIVFTGLLLTYTFAMHRFPAIPRIASLMAVLVCLVSAWPLGPGAGGGSHRHRTFDDFWPLASAAIAIGCGAGLGILNGNQIKPWLRAAHLTEYLDVPADMASSQVVADAAWLEFVPGTSLDSSRSVGFFTGGHRYCVSPVVGPSYLEQPSPIAFWAVGMDCCSSRGDFWCSDATDPNATKALIHEVSAWNLLFGNNASTHFLDAVKMAASTYGLTVLDEDPVLLDWVADPKDVALDHWRLAVITCYSLTLLGSLFFALVGCHLFRSMSI